MDNGLHFISGLPRSGSTLLSAILRQNPKFHATMSSPVGSLFQRLHHGMAAPGGFAVMMDDAQREDILRGIFDIYYKATHPTKLVFDTNRLWCSQMPLVAHLFPQSKVIVCVRELAWIMDSFERIQAKSPLIISKMFKPRDAATIYTRVNALGNPHGTVGYAWNATQEALFGDFADRLIVIDYEALTRDPKRAMTFLYEKLGLPEFEHDFDNVEFEANEEFDKEIGVPGLHRVAKKVQYSERPTILPPDLVERFSGRNFWRRPAAQARKAAILLPANLKQPIMPPGGPRQMMRGMGPPAGV
ncbi:sulfotransferase family protein [Methylovirgula sp. 4M-Z18]|uniref:sulfotransferase family protein n=1 Tax=Methylovirgula sp. 4M-Z18 TaxID=2293567 RepID=UPI000E2F4A7D|nr:sulfotransferase [Methylovirgula sp. 4M-Z18]RFB77947.1 sulfotransferase [Methylovirgula sp. 4M-Z18]